MNLLFLTWPISAYSIMHCAQHVAVAVAAVFGGREFQTIFINPGVCVVAECGEDKD